MKSLLRLFTVSLIAAQVIGCGAKTVAVRPDAVAKVHTIVLIRIIEPAAYTAQDFGNPGMMFGAVGGAVAGSSAANATKSVNQVATNAGFTAGERLTGLLQEKLTLAGYDVRLVTASREKGHELLEKYDDVQASGADAILDIAIESIGYATEHPMLSPHWRPSAQIKVALVDSSTHNVIFADKYMYGYHNPFMSGTDLDAPEEFHFKDTEVLFADDARLVEGMQDSLQSIADRIVTTLKK